VLKTPPGLPRGITFQLTKTSALYVLEDARPHIIRPHQAKALRFEVEGRVVFAAVVHQPGTRANNFLARALHEAR
jgi:hypothetical protein